MNNVNAIKIQFLLLKIASLFSLYSNQMFKKDKQIKADIIPWVWLLFKCVQNLNKNAELQCLQGHFKYSEKDLKCQDAFKGIEISENHLHSTSLPNKTSRKSLLFIISINALLKLQTLSRSFTVTSRLLLCLIPGKQIKTLENFWCFVIFFFQALPNNKLILLLVYWLVTHWKYYLPAYTFNLWNCFSGESETKRSAPDYKKISCRPLSHFLPRKPFGISTYVSW